MTAAAERARRFSEPLPAVASTSTVEMYAECAYSGGRHAYRRDKKCGTVLDEAVPGDLEPSLEPGDHRLGEPAGEHLRCELDALLVGAVDPRQATAVGS